MGAVEHPIQFRVLPLQGGLNLRDMGGYSTGDGRRVKTGMLYRSGRMSSLTDADEAHLAGLGIRSVCDLRNTDERSRHPTRWCAAGATELWARDYEDYSGQLDKLMRKDDATVDEAHNAMVTLYRELPIHHAQSYRWMFARLAAAEVPLLFNCTAGKDRTGVGAALLLHALGVPHEQIVEDYAATNDADLTPLTGGHAGPPNLAPAVGARLLAADPAYLEATWDELGRLYGGVDAYLARELDVDRAVRDRLGALLLD